MGKESSNVTMKRVVMYFPACLSHSTQMELKYRTTKFGTHSPFRGTLMRLFWFWFRSSKINVTYGSKMGGRWLRCSLWL